MFPWQRVALIWRLVSHGCVSLPHRPPLCLTDGSCDCNHPSYCQKQKKKKRRARKGKSHTPSRSRSLVSSKQGTPMWAEPTHGPQALCIVCVPGLVWLTARTCVGVHLWLSVPALYCMISHWSVHGGEAVDMSDLAADQKHQRLVPLWSCERALISTRLCSVDRKNKRRETDRQRKRRRGTWRERQKQAGIAKMKGCIKRPEWSMTMIHNRTYLSVLMS